MSPKPLSTHLASAFRRLTQLNQALASLNDTERSRRIWQLLHRQQLIILDAIRWQDEATAAALRRLGSRDF